MTTKRIVWVDCTPEQRERAAQIVDELKAIALSSKSGLDLALLPLPPQKP